MDDAVASPVTQTIAKVGLCRVEASTSVRTIGPRTNPPINPDDLRRDLRHADSGTVQMNCNESLGDGSL